MPAMTLYDTRRCPICGGTTALEVEVAKLRRWQAGEYVQSVWPEWSVGRRELLISGTHPICWTRTFGNADDA